MNARCVADPNAAQAHGQLGSILDFAGHHEQALEWFERALRLDPQFHVWIHSQGRALFALQRYSVSHTLSILPCDDPAPLDHFVQGLRKAGLKP